MKVSIFCVTKPYMSGSQNMMLRLLNGLQSLNNIDISLICTDINTPLVEKVNKDNLKIIELAYPDKLDKYDNKLLKPLELLKSLFSIYSYGKELKKISLKNDLDIIYFSNIRGLLPAIFFNFKSTKIIWNIFLGRKSKGIWWLINYLGLYKSDRIIFEYHNQAREIFTNRQYLNYNYKFKTIYTPIDFPEENKLNVKYISSSKIVIGFAGTLIKRKGFDIFIQVASYLQNHKEFDFEFIIAGDVINNSDLRFLNNLRKVVTKNNLDFKFLGWVDDMSSFWEKIDIFLFPSRFEGMPGVVREAMSYSVPVVASNIGGIKEAIHDAGIVVEGESLDDYANAIIRLAKNSNLRNIMGKNGRQRVEKLFCKEQYIDSMNELFRETVTK